MAITRKERPRIKRLQSSCEKHKRRKRSTHASIQV